MTNPLPLGFIGNGIARIFTMAVPSERVRRLIPAGLGLADQELTPEGTHPVLFLFQRFSQCQFSFPTAIPSMNFQEYAVSIPYTCVRAGYGPLGGLGPYSFLPKFYLDNAWVMSVGMMMWGFDKEIGSLAMSDRSCKVSDIVGRRVASLEISVEDMGNTRPVNGYKEFDPVRRMLDQRLISAFPASVGPWLGLSDFDRRWNLANVRPLDATLELTSTCLAAFEPGLYSTSDGRTPWASAYEFHAPWWLSLPYYGMLPFEPDFRAFRAVV